MEVVVAAVSALISLVALVVSIWVSRRQTGIQERLASIEAARRAEEVEARGRARVTASLRFEERDHQGRERRLVVRNEGLGLAKDVSVTTLAFMRIPKIHGLEDFPIDLQPGQEMTFFIAWAVEDRPTWTLLVHWTDEAGNHLEPYTLRAF